MGLELDPSAATAATETEAPATETDPAVAAEGAAATTEPAAAAPVVQEDTEDRRARRAAESELSAIRAKLREAEESAAKLKPYADLETVGREDPARWISEMAEAQGVTPQRVLEMITKRGAGEPAALTAEERVAKLERLIAERDARDDQDRAARAAGEASAKASETRKSNVGVVAEFIKANAAKEFPGLDESDADEVFQVVEARWAQLPEHGRPTDQAGLRAFYIDASKRVEAAARAEVERRSGRFGYSKPTSVQTPTPNSGFRGLSVANTTAPATPNDSDRVNTSEDIDALVSRMFS